MTSSSALLPESVTSPHDAYVKGVFRRLPQARGFFRGYLPDDVQRLFDWRTLRLESESFLSDELQRDFADLRFSVRLIGDCGSASHHVVIRAQAAAAVQHASRQLHRYISRQLEETPANEPLPGILTMVLLQSWHVEPVSHPFRRV